MHPAVRASVCMYTYAHMNRPGVLHRSLFVSLGDAEPSYTVHLEILFVDHAAGVQQRERQTRKRFALLQATFPPSNCLLGLPYYHCLVMC